MGNDCSDDIEFLNRNGLWKKDNLVESRYGHLYTVLYQSRQKSFHNSNYEKSPYIVKIVKKVV